LYTLYTDRCTLFISQRFDRVQTACPHGRHYACDECDHADQQHYSPDRERLERKKSEPLERSRVEFDESLVCDESGSDGNAGAQYRAPKPYQYRFEREDSKDPTTAHSECFLQADLFGSLEHSDDQRVDNAK